MPFVRLEFFFIPKIEIDSIKAIPIVLGCYFIADINPSDRCLSYKSQFSSFILITYKKTKSPFTAPYLK